MDRLHICRPTPWRVVALALISSLGAAGCDRGGAEKAAAAADASAGRDSAGVSVVTSRAGRWKEADRWRLEANLTLGAVEGPAAFQAVRSLALDSAGGLYVLDGDARVRVFAADGTPRRAFGGRGGGPGEFRHPSSVGITADGRLGVGETYPPVIHWLTADGAPLGSLSVPPAGGSDAAVLASWKVSRSGAAFVELATFDPARTDAWPTVLLSWRVGATHPDTVARWTRPPVRLDRIRLFDPTHSWAVRADGALYLASGDRYEVRVLAPSGELAKIVRREVRPRPVTAEMKARAVAEVRGWMSGPGAPPVPVDPEGVRIEAASVLPAVERIWVSEPDGSLWVGVLTGAPGSSLERPGAYDVFDPTGRYLGRIPAPPGFELLRVTRGAAYGRWKDELDVPYVRRYRIVRPAETPLRAPRPERKFGAGGERS